MERDHIIDAAERDLAKLDAQRQAIADFIEQYKRYKGAAFSAPVPPDAISASINPQRSAPVDTVMSAVHDILLERKDALTLSAIFEGLQARDVVVGGKNPKQNLSQKLSAHPQIKSYGKRGWYFADSVPPCLREPRLPSERQYEEGPVMEMTRPPQVNGAAVSAA